VQRLTDFKPLQRVALPRLGELDSSGLILIVGPNSSGKTQLLQDLHQRTIGMRRALVVAKAIEIRKPEQLEPFLNCLVEEGYIARVDQGGTEQLRPLATFAGTGGAGGQINAQQAKEWFQLFSVEDVRGAARGPTPFLSYFGQLVVTALFLGNRLTSVNQVPMFDHEAQPPANDLHALYVDDLARTALQEEVRATFGRAVWPDASRGNQLCLRVSDEGDFPSAAQQLSPKTAATYRTIETEGDGVKSYVSTCIALLLGRRPVCLIDEPELCLHPPQAYSLGRFIGTFGTSTERATFVATHSSHVLRGVLQTAERLQIVRLVRRDRSFEAHLIPPDVLDEILKKPTVRAEAVLDGVFAQAVIVVEADGDRAVYQAVFETLGNEFRLDIHFTAVGGIGGVADVCRLYRTLRIPVAVIADLDVVTDADRLKRIVSELAGGPEAEAVKRAAARVSSAIKRLPPTVSPEDVKLQLAAAAARAMDWSQNEDAPLREALQALAQSLDRMRRLKGDGIAGLPRELAGEAEALVGQLAALGLFVVPVGELEQWLAGVGVTASKQNKWAWANEAAAKVRLGEPQKDDVWAFIRAVATFLLRALNRPPA
jgi:hypothetical protein